MLIRKSFILILMIASIVSAGEKYIALWEGFYDLESIPLTDKEFAKIVILTEIDDTNKSESTLCGGDGISFINQAVKSIIWELRTDCTVINSKSEFYLKFENKVKVVKNTPELIQYLNLLLKKKPMGGKTKVQKEKSRSDVVNWLDNPSEEKPAIKGETK